MLLMGETAHEPERFGMLWVHTERSFKIARGFPRQTAPLQRGHHVRVVCPRVRIHVASLYELGIHGARLSEIPGPAQLFGILQSSRRRGIRGCIGVMPRGQY